MLLCPMAAYKPAILHYVCVVPIAACRCLFPIMSYLLYSRLYPWPSASSSQHHLRRHLVFLHYPCNAVAYSHRCCSYGRGDDKLLHASRAHRRINIREPHHDILQQHTLEAVDSQGVTAHIRKTVLPSTVKQPANQHQQTDAQQRPRQSANELHRQLQWVMEQHIISQYRRTTPRHEQEDDRRRSCHPPPRVLSAIRHNPSSHSLTKRI